MDEDQGAVDLPDGPTFVPKAKAPEPTSLEGWQHFDLHTRVQKVLSSLPRHFKSGAKYRGLLATDVYSINTSQATLIEQGVVETLNERRSKWDPSGDYREYRFVRQSQRFPDVLLVHEKSNEILFGIELKGWYLLAKEQEPSFRLHVSANVCAPADLLVVFPWALSEVISGKPQLFQPFITQMRFAAEYRNFFWQEARKAMGRPAGISVAPHTSPYPPRSAKINDAADNDKDGNLGRIARAGLLVDFVRQTDLTLLRGIPVCAWRGFLRSHVDRGVL